MTCKHENFSANVNVNRFHEHPGVVHCDITAKCTKCGRSVEFEGLPLGISFYRPTVSLDGQTLQAPGKIGRADMPTGLAGFDVQLKPGMA